MPVNSTSKTMWEDQVRAAYLLDPSTGEPYDPSAIAIGSIAAGESHIGEVGAPDDLIEVTPALDTAAYASGDVLFAPTVLLNAVRVSGGKAILESILVQDKDKQSGAFDLLVFRSQTVMGANLNFPEAITDANGQEILAVIQFISSDYVAFTNFSMARKSLSDTGMGMMLEPTTGTSLWIAAVSRDTKTYSASGLIFKLGLLRA